MDAREAATWINTLHQGTFAGSLGIEVTSATRDGIEAHFTVQPTHRQPQGIVHGGVYATIVETLASVGAAIDAMEKGKQVVGLENHTTFVRATREGTLAARATPVTRGRRTQVWDVEIRNAQSEIVASGRVRLLVLDPGTEVAGRGLGG